MKFKSCCAALALCALLVPAAAIGQGEGLTMKVVTKERSAARKLAAKVTCVNQPCDVSVAGTARVGARKFELKPKARSLVTGEKEKFKLRARKLGQLEDLLAETDGEATVKVKATGPTGSTAKLTAKITLTG
jgi:hypothetical protein